MNAILLCFILLATMFVASGISNVVSVMNGTDSYLDKAGIGDYVVISMGADSKASIDEILHEMESIRDYRIEPVVFGEKSNLKDMHGEELEAKNSVIYQSIEDSRLKFFDKENKQITQIKPGHAYATGDFMEKNHLQPGSGTGTEAWNCGCGLCHGNRSVCDAGGVSAVLFCTSDACKGQRRKYEDNRKRNEKYLYHRNSGNFKSCTSFHSGVRIKCNPCAVSGKLYSGARSLL